jgi:hypothetical protein
VCVVSPTVFNQLTDFHIYKILVEKSEGNRPLGRPRHKWEDTRMDLKK